jgi:putative membrane protein insertion efficiency factor
MTTLSHAPHPNPAAREEGVEGNEREWPHAVVDLFACAVLAVAGSAFVWVVNPFSGFHFQQPLALALFFALLGPFGAGVDRGRAPGIVRVLAPLGAATGALVGALLIEHVSAPLELLVRIGSPLVLGPLLVPLGARLHRHEEAWRPEARLRPPEATPDLALKIAAARFPLPLRVLLLPVTIALLPVGFLGVVLIRCYQLSIARLLPPQCRFEPSCSRYGLQAFTRYGALKGFLLTALRLARCHPFCRAGHDPLPDGVDGGPG